MAELTPQTSAFWFQVQWSVPVSPPLFSPNKTLPWAMPWFQANSHDSPAKPSLFCRAPCLFQRKVLLVWFILLLKAPSWCWPVAWDTDCVPPCQIVTFARVDFCLSLSHPLCYKQFMSRDEHLSVSPIESNIKSCTREWRRSLNWPETPCRRPYRYWKSFPSTVAFYELGGPSSSKDKDVAKWASPFCFPPMLKYVQ